MSIDHSSYVICIYRGRMCISISFVVVCSIPKDASQRLTAWGRKQGTHYTNLSFILWHCCSGFPRKLPAQLFLRCGYLSKLLNAYCSCGHCAPTFSAWWGQNHGCLPALLCKISSSLLGTPHSRDNRRLRSCNSSKEGRWNARSSLPHPVQA